MTKQDFEKFVTDELKNRLDQNEYSIQSTTMFKENGCVVNAIAVSCNGNVMPLIKVDVLYQEYLDGVPTNFILKKLLKELENGVSSHIDLFVEKIEDFDLVKNNIFASIVNTDYNKMWLLDKPHRDIGDLSIVYNVIFQQDKDKIMRVAITDKMFEEWGIEADTLHNTAIKNTNREYAPVLTSIESKIKELLDLTNSCEDVQIELPTGMIVVSNNIGMYGAIHMFNVEMLRKISETLKSKQLYIIPSSVHEIIVCVTDLMSLEYADQMVQEVNQTMDPKDVLSNHVYLYDRDTNKIS